MSPLDQYLVETAMALAQSDEEAQRTVTSTLPQRIAIGLAQARAKECRHLAGQLQITGATKHPIMRAYAAILGQRSSQLEAIGLSYCEKWPPGDEREEPRIKLVGS